MKAECLEYLFSGIDEKTLDGILGQRYKRLNRKEKKSAVTQKRVLSRICAKRTAAAAVAAVVCAVAVAVTPGIVRNVAESRNTVTVMRPQYVANFSSPELKEVYKTEPFSELLPEIIPSGLLFESSYVTEYDEIANPDDRKFLALEFRSADGKETLSIKMSEYDGKVAPADPTDPETYRLDIYYDMIENQGKIPAECPNVFRPVLASDLTSEIALAKMYYHRSGLPGDFSRAAINLICGAYEISYSYTVYNVDLGEGAGAELFYGMITSSQYFKNMRSEK